MSLRRMSSSGDNDGGGGDDDTFPHSTNQVSLFHSVIKSNMSLSGSRSL